MVGAEFRQGDRVFPGFFREEDQKYLVTTDVYTKLQGLGEPIDLTITLEWGRTEGVRVVGIHEEVVEGEMMLVFTTGPIPDSGVIPEGYGGAWGLSSPATWR